MNAYWVHLKRAHNPRGKTRRRRSAARQRGYDKLGRRGGARGAPGGLIDNPDDLRCSKGDGYAPRDDQATLERVGEVQGLLEKWGATSLEEDDVFGPKTEAAVKAFQASNGLPASGVVDVATSNALQNTDSVPIGGKVGTPASSSKTGLYVAIGALALGGLALGVGGAAHKRKAA